MAERSPVKGRAKARRNSSRPGLWMVIIGALIAVFFAIIAITTSASNTSIPFWIFVGWGGLVMLFGLYRLIRGRSSLDHPKGGTDVNGQ